MKQTLHWNKLTVEAIVIVGSILLAFAIDAWWEARQDQIGLQSNLDALVKDMVIAQGSIEAAIEKNKATVLRLAEAHRVLQSEVNNDFQLPEASIHVSPIPLGTLRLLVSSGDVRLIVDEEVRLKLIEGLSKIELFQGWMDDLATDGRRVSELLIFEENKSLTTEPKWPASAFGNANVLASVSILGGRIDNIHGLLQLVRDLAKEIEEASLKELASH